MAESKIISFRRLVWQHYRKNGRYDLPWRKTKDVYNILVSEVMLQQTQVGRVVPFYEKFIKQFPTARRLSDAPLADVLRAWQGLGYNRRAKMLKDAARGLTGKKKFTVAELETFPGVGPYTARAVAAFAYNEDVIFVETNIRTAIIHHFFPRRRNVKDAEIEKILVAISRKGSHESGIAHSWITGHSSSVRASRTTRGAPDMRSNLDLPVRCAKRAALFCARLQAEPGRARNY